MVENIVAEGDATIVLVASIADPAMPPPRAPLARRALAQLDHALFRTSHPLARMDIRPLLADVPSLAVQATGGSFAAAGGDALGVITSYEMDVALKLGRVPLSPALLAIPPWGVWEHTLGGRRLSCEPQPAFWEVARRQSVILSGMCRVGLESSADELLYSSVGPTDRLSVARTCDHAFAKMAAFAPRLLRDVRRGAHARMSSATDLLPSPSAHEIRPARGRGSVSSGVWSIVTRTITAALARPLTDERWTIAYSRSGYAEHFGTSSPDPLADLSVLSPPPGLFWADPFPVSIGGRTYVFVEEVPLATRIGRIAVLDLSNGRGAPRAHTVLEQPYHLSYPFPFQWNDSWYLLPETGANRRIELYTTSDFPYGWQLDRVLLADVEAADATLLEIGGIWWMFVTIAPSGGSTWDELHLFSAPSPIGPWSAHPGNPVRSDVRNSRPAGRPFFRNGTLFRPAQDCSGRYGRAVVINRVDRLDRHGFSEMPVARVHPRVGSDAIGVHTLNATDELTVVDLRLRRWRFAPRDGGCIGRVGLVTGASGPHPAAPLSSASVGTVW